MHTIVIPVVSDLPAKLNTTAADASWVITATLLAGAVTAPITGRLGDMFGKRRVLLACIALLVVGSAICAEEMSSWLPMVIVGRALQGTTAGVIPLGISILRDELPPERVPGAVAVISATMGVGASIGPPVAGLVVQSLDWRMLFWATGLMAQSHWPSSRSARARESYTPPRAVRLRRRVRTHRRAGLPAPRREQGSSVGLGSAVVLMLLGAAVVILVVWVRYELHVVEPVVDLRVARARPTLLTNLASIMTGFAMYANFLVLPQLLQAPAATGYGLGQSVSLTGLYLGTGGLVIMLVSLLAARVSGKFVTRSR